MSTTKFKNNLHVTGTLTVDEDVTISGTITGANSSAVITDIPATGTVQAQASTATLDADDFGKINTNTGASGAITLTLPAASTVAGQLIKFAVTAAQIINVSPAATDGIFLNGSGADNKDLIIAGVIGNYATVYSNGTNYEVYNTNGVVTKEA